MTTYQVTTPFKIKGQLQPIGTILTLAEDQASRLAGYVKQAGTFEATGDPVSCPYWLRVCWAVQMYQEQCTRCTACRVYQFLERQES
jgi:hypothetical protein